MKQQVNTIFSNYWNTIKLNWSEALKSKVFRLLAMKCFIIIVVFSYFIGSYLSYIETRLGCQLRDDFIVLLPVIDLTWPIFTIIYLSIIGVLIYCLSRPWLLLASIQMFALMYFIRSICMFIVPLEPPVDIIPLEDPVLSMFAYPGKSILRDLFFSGHTGTLVLLCLVVRKHKYFFRVLCFLTLLMGLFLLLQRCHYTIDVLAAVPASYFSYAFIRWIWRKTDLNLDQLQ